MKEFILPDIGEGIVECELLAWLVAEGDLIQEDQPVAEVMTDKATVQIPAMYSGTVAKLHYQVGEIAKVHEPLFSMHTDETSSSSFISSQPSLSESNTRQLEVHEDFILPDIGEGIVECELVKWLVAEGDTVKEDQVVVEVMTDKAMVEIPAKHAGIISKHYYAEGDVAKVHTPLYQLTLDAVEKTSGKTELVPSKPESEPAFKDAKQTETSGKNNHKVLASPAVRRVAREKGIDLSQIKGSGDKGRILKQDLNQQIQGEPTEQSQDHIAPTNNVPQPALTIANRVESIRGVKAAMAKQMSLSASTIPHFSVSEEIQMDALIAARAQLKSEFEKQGQKLSFMPFFVKALSLALHQFPIVNSRVNQDCTELTYLSEHNIGVAVDGKLGLLVPNIKSVQTKSVFEVTQEFNRIVEAAREGRLANSDLQGGSISISNIGVLGGTVATPIINTPESAIVALGKIQRLPRFDNSGQVIAANIMQISWSGDHRIIDGATMVRFNNAWKAYLEQPLNMLAELR